MRESTVVQMWLREGREEGLAEGREEGELREARRMLPEVVQLRFGPVAAESIANDLEQICDIEKLEQLLQPFVKAPIFDGVVQARAV